MFSFNQGNVDMVHYHVTLFNPTLCAYKNMEIQFEKTNEQAKQNYKSNLHSKVNKYNNTNGDLYNLPTKQCSLSLQSYRQLDQ